MKPLKLTIQAFGPFVGREEIDFTQLGNNPLFLINGPTGSGKSSILDAICFALYGQTTGAERDATQMRCDQADAKTLTEVTLDFSLGDKQYRIRRTPFQEKAKERGEGLTAHTGSAELNEISKTGELNLIVAKKIKQATDEIERLTGLNVEQFRQVMVLPQGKFRELLLANSNERQQIFSQLFQTNIYKKIEDTLKEKSRAIRENVKAHQNKIKGILEAADLPSTEAVDDSINALIPSLEKTKSNKETANARFLKAVNEKESAEALVKNFADQVKVQVLLDKKNQQKPIFEEKQNMLDKAMFANKIRSVFDELTRIKNDKHKLSAEIKKIHSALDNANNKYQVAESLLIKCKDDDGAIENINQDVSKLKRFESKVDELESAIKTANASEQIYLVSKNNAKAVQSTFNTKIKQKEVLEERITDVQNKLSDIVPKQARLQSLAEQNKLLKKLVDNKTRYSHLITQLARANEHVEDVTGIFEKSLQQARTIEMHWHAGQAVILAGKLEEGIPCPVCGSEKHPHPATTENSQTVVTKEQMDEARAQSEKDRVNMQLAKDSVTDINSQVAPVAGQIKEIEKELNEILPDGSASGVLGSDALDKDNLDTDTLAKGTLEEIEVTYKKLEKEVSNLESLQTALAKDKSDLINRRSEIEKLLVTVNQNKEKADEDNIKYTQDQSAVNHIEKELPAEFRHKSDLLQAIQNLQVRAQAITEALNKAQTRYDVCKESVTKLSTGLQGFNNRKEALAKQENSQQEKWLNALHSSPFESEQQYLDSMLEEDAVAALSRDIDDYHETLNQLKGALQQHDKNLKGKNKPDIESLSILLDEKQEELKVADAAWNELHSRHVQLKDVQKKLNKAHEENKKLEADYAIYGTLSEVANGRTGNRISLQRFVLGVLLDDVLSEASLKLYKMTNGRYQLLRRQERSKGGGASGLELDVEDSYTGKTRSVATLSGGESFMAALALALGLSDVVQAYAGGIRLDALFIDEGFGSLDQESLDLAIRTLVDLQETGRMIGIISHVSELKEQMALRLDVVSTKAGSSIKLHAS